MGVAEEKAINEVKYWLKENGYTMSNENIEKVGEKALKYYINKDYSSMENAVDDILMADSKNLKILIPIKSKED